MNTKNFENIPANGGIEITACHLRHSLHLYIQCLAVDLKQDLVTGAKLDFGIYAVLAENTYALFAYKARKCINGGLEIGKSALARFVLPLLGVVIAVKDYSLVLFYGGLDYFKRLVLNVICLFKSVRKYGKHLGNCGIERGIGA